ncbi:serine/threonine protein kinase [Actinoallomurus purpureus]|uniref:serine/threonine-protein kinase n=1 Tax=Actinoallomurus purpureus TaxID=478114 RepID=UPI0020929DF0|nr:serine/threonine-protein kinase [Actinoallomurus purpureus]MCO6010363.1 serine/threonine protein kinase [Actinoallomurus purpureus]
MRVGDRYELLGRLGQGGMGTVWRAHDELLRRDVAIKEVLLPPELGEAERAERHARTIREARSAARLSTPGAVTVHDVIEHEGRPWIVMELVAAPSLQSLIDAEGPLPPQRVAALGRQMLAALRAAHAAGILHRDIKPSNVLVADGDRAVITDFGIAALEGDATLTGTGVLMGSPAYIAPERARDAHAGPAADLWSLGATLYAAVEGRSPFARSGPVSTLAAILAEEAPPPRNAGPLAPVLAGLLRRDPADRMLAAEADRLLSAVAEGTHPDVAALTLPVPAPPPAAPAAATVAVATVATAPSRRPAMVAVAGALAGALVVAAFGAVWWLGRRSGTNVPAATSSVATSLPGSPGTAEPGGSSPEASPAAGRSTAVADAFPRDWTTRSESGFSVSVPASWSRRADGENVFYEDSSTRFVLQIGTTYWDGDPQVQAQTVSAALPRSFSGYREATVTPVTYLGVPAADLRFAYDRSTGTSRVNDRFFRVGGRAFAIYFRMPADQWPDAQRYLDPIFGGFHVS